MSRPTQCARRRRRRSFAFLAIATVAAGARETDFTSEQGTRQQKADGETRIRRGVLWCGGKRLGARIAGRAKIARVRQRSPAGPGHQVQPSPLASLATPTLPPPPPQPTPSLPPPSCLPLLSPPTSPAPLLLLLPVCALGESVGELRVPNRWPEPWWRSLLPAAACQRAGYQGKGTSGGER